MESISSSPFQQFLEASPRNDNGVLLFSTHRKYQHEEHSYDQQYHISPDDYTAGQGLHAMALSLGIPVSMPVLELGCGTGRLSVGLLKFFPASQLLLTDASIHFLSLLSKKICTAQLPVPHLGLFNFDDLHLLPNDMFGLILLRSALHHVDDYATFLSVAARKLLPGGAICCQEPLHEGLFTLGLLARTVKPPLFDMKISSDLDLLVRTMAFYCRRDVDKSHAEDKHAFRLSGMLAASNNAGLRLHFYANKSFEDFSGEAQDFSFSIFAQRYLQYCMNFSDKTVRYFMRHAASALSYIDMTAGMGNAPESSGVFVLQRPA